MFKEIIEENRASELKGKLPLKAKWIIIDVQTLNTACCKKVIEVLDGLKVEELNSLGDTCFTGGEVNLMIEKAKEKFNVKEVEDE